MPEVVQSLPCCRTDLVIAPAGEAGRYVVKNAVAPRLLPDRGRGTFPADPVGWQPEHPLDLRRVRGSLRPGTRLRGTGRIPGNRTLAGTAAGGVVRRRVRINNPRVPRAVPRRDPFPASCRGRCSRPAVCRPRAQARRVSWQSVLSWRVNLFDPDRFFTWLEPQIRFCWTRAFLIVSATSIVLAAATVWLHRQELVGSLIGALRWEMIVLTWLVLFGVTTLHEFAHGLTCKHYGGEVREVGFLMLLLMPCFYCNVSDAWMFRDKSKRLWVMFAGAYFELFAWSGGVFAWRLAQPGTVPHDLAFALLSASGLATLFNFNPLIKLDGYYLLSDALEVPNLHGRALEYTQGQIRRLLWGAPRPAGEPRGRLLLSFGLISWLYSAAFVALMLWALTGLVGQAWGWLGAIGVGLLVYIVIRGLFRGFSGGEIHKMMTTRHLRTAAWLFGLGGLIATLGLVEIEDRAGGTFRLRPADRAGSARAVAGFWPRSIATKGTTCRSARRSRGSKFRI